jgi:hypothetical protein
MKIDKNMMISMYTLLLFIGCGEEVISIENNTTTEFTKKQEKTRKIKEDTLKSIPQQTIVEEKQVVKDEVPREEPLEVYVMPKSEAELADEQSIIIIKEDIEEEVYQGVLPVKSKEELLGEDTKAEIVSAFQKSDEELADEIKSK